MTENQYRTAYNHLKVKNARLIKENAELEDELTQWADDSCGEGVLTFTDESAQEWVDRETEELNDEITALNEDIGDLTTFECHKSADFEKTITALNAEIKALKEQIKTEKNT